MNTRFLGTFCVVAELGSLNAAARQLGLSSTAVGMQIKTLEGELNAELLSRRGRHVVLTEAGQALLPAARDVLDRIGELSQIVQPDEPQGQIRIGVVQSVIVSVLPSALRHMARCHPKIELRVYPGNAPHLYQRLERGDLDCMISGHPRFALPKSMVWHPIRDEPLVLLYTGSVKGDTIDQLIAAAPFIRLERSSWTGQIVTRFLESRAIRTRDLFELDAPGAIVTLVAEGVGVALLPDWGIVEPAGFELRRLPVGDPAYDRQLGLIGLRTTRARLIAIFAAALRTVGSHPGTV